MPQFGAPRARRAELLSSSLARRQKALSARSLVQTAAAQLDARRRSIFQQLMRTHTRSIIDRTHTHAGQPVAPAGG